MQHAGLPLFLSRVLPKTRVPKPRRIKVRKGLASEPFLFQCQPFQVEGDE